MKFKAKVVPAGNAAGIEVPSRVMTSLGQAARPPIAITINGHTWRSRIAVMSGRSLVGISAANRVASGIAVGKVATIDVALDTEPRVVAPPADLAKALKRDSKASAAFDRLPFGLKRKYVGEIDSAKADATRQRRIAKLVSRMRSGGR